ncbi:GntR family transcriptional regulator [Pseudoprimorskyibacter insulae]|uniref:HTH-type transcriptional repressor RspR n=1 Tax=Pseudoprimorskyibacter insulae TaxID=1695997 RepID=A0A2R8AWK9_9RHOB|nr:GntR family transcriptional regulator [Pseudoprimorskyibacter insulae]SPF80259.1 HTH-type transcriptional repressor RspR [Pseudoprimorskyibacter insulae]
MSAILKRKLDPASERKTNADLVFQDLREQIVSLELMPGTKMSEVEVADRYGVSRQPVREAFTRLSAQGFLLIQPQKATEVRRFSLPDIRAARFIRLAVELEVLRCACANWSDDHSPAFEVNLAAQEKATAENDTLAFHTLDGAFHELISEVAGRPYAFDVVEKCRALVHRICVLSLRRLQEMEELTRDHRALYDSIRTNDPAQAEQLIRRHLTHIDQTIDAVHVNHPDLFEN